MVGNEIRKWLSSDTTLIAMLANTKALHPEKLPENASFPCLVFENERGGERRRNYGGLSNSRNITKITLKVWADAVGKREKIIDRLEKKMNGYSGAIGDIAKASVTARVIARVSDGTRNRESAIIDLNIKHRS